MFVSQESTLHKTWHKNPNRKQNARSVTVKLVSLTCWQCFRAVTSCSGVVTLQFSFCWHKHGVRAVTASCLFLYTSARLMQCSPLLSPFPLAYFCYLVSALPSQVPLLVWEEFFLLVLLIPCPVKGMVYAGRKILQSLEGLLQQGFCWHSWEARKKILADTVKGTKCWSVAGGFPVQVFCSGYCDGVCVCIFIIHFCLETSFCGSISFKSWIVLEEFLQLQHPEVPGEIVIFWNIAGLF